MAVPFPIHFFNTTLFRAPFLLLYYTSFRQSPFNKIIIEIL